MWGEHGIWMLILDSRCQPTKAWHTMPPMAGLCVGVIELGRPQTRFAVAALECCCRRRRRRPRRARRPGVLWVGLGGRLPRPARRLPGAGRRRGAARRPARRGAPPRAAAAGRSRAGSWCEGCLPRAGRRFVCGCKRRGGAGLHWQAPHGGWLQQRWIEEGARSSFSGPIVLTRLGAFQEQRHRAGSFCAGVLARPRTQDVAVLSC